MFSVRDEALCAHIIFAAHALRREYSKTVRSHVVQMKWSGDPRRVRNGVSFLPRFCRSHRIVKDEPWSGLERKVRSRPRLTKCCVCSPIFRGVGQDYRLGTTDFTELYSHPPRDFVWRCKCPSISAPIKAVKKCVLKSWLDATDVVN